MGGLPAAWLEAGAAAMISSLHPVLTGPARRVLWAVLSDLIGTDRTRPAQVLRRAQLSLARELAGQGERALSGIDDAPRTATIDDDPASDDLLRRDRDRDVPNETGDGRPAEKTDGAAHNAGNAITAAAFAFVTYGA